MARTYYKLDTDLAKTYTYLDTTSSTSVRIHFYGEIEAEEDPEYRLVDLQKARFNGYTATSEDVLRANSMWREITKQEFQIALSKFEPLFQSTEPGTVYYRVQTVDNDLTVLYRFDPQARVCYKLYRYRLEYGFPFANLLRTYDESYDRDLQYATQYGSQIGQLVYNTGRQEFSDIFS
jgi:hypothetical protein